MSNDFFSDHPMLGSMFDLDRDDSMSLGEAGAMGAFGAMYATEAMRAAEEAEREADRSFEDFETSKKKKKARKKSHDDLWYDNPWDKKLEKIDTYDHDEVFEAVINDELGMYGTEDLVCEALDHGIRFDAEETEEIIGAHQRQGPEATTAVVARGLHLGRSATIAQ